MRKEEIISLVLIIAAVVVLIIGLQMDYGSARKWMTILSFVLLALSLNPKSFWKKKKTQMVEEPDETEEDEAEYIELPSQVLVDKKAVNRSETYLTFQDKLSDVYYYIHYVDGEAYETYASEIGYLVRIDYDELDDSYQTIDGLFEAVEADEVYDSIYTFSAEDFIYIRKRYQDWKVSLSQTSNDEPERSEPVNRVGRAVAYIMVVSIFAFVLLAISRLSFISEVDGGYYILIFIILGVVSLLAFWQSLRPDEWLKYRIKWLSDNEEQKIDVFGGGKVKQYWSMDHDNLIQYEYRPKQKQLVITKTIQIPLDNEVKEEFDRRQEACKEFAATHPFIEFYDVPFFDWLGTYSFSFTIPKSKATKAAMKELQEWLSQPLFDSSNVCGYFKYNEYGGTFFIKYQNCHLTLLVFVHEDGTQEVFDPNVNTLSDETLSDEIKDFYVDFEEFYCWKIKEEHRIDASEWPI